MRACRKRDTSSNGSVTKGVVGSIRPLRVSARRAEATRVTLGRGSEACYRLAPELLADDRGPLEHDPLGDREAVEPRVQHGGDRGRHLDLGCASRTLVDHRRELLDEERVAVGRLDDAAAERRVRDAEVVEQLAALARAEWLELDHDGACRRRPQSAQLGPGQAEKHHRRIPAPGGEILDEIEQHRLGEVEVVDAEHERPLARERFDGAANGPEDLVARNGCRGVPDRDLEPLAHGRRVRAGEWQRLDPTGGADDLAEGPEGDPAAVRDAAAPEHGAAAADAREELAREPGLADPGWSEHEDGDAAAPLLRPAEGGLKALQLAAAADERPVAAPAHAFRRRVDSGHAPCLERQRLPFRREWRHRLEHGCSRHELGRHGAEQDLARSQPPPPGASP